MAEFKHLIRVAKTDLKGEKSLGLALTKIKGVGFMFSHVACYFAGVDRHKKAGDLTDAEVQKLEDVIENPSKHNIPTWFFNRRKDYETGEDKHIIIGDLKFTKENDVKRLRKIKSYRGSRHNYGLPSRGQRTKSNFRKSKSKGKGGLGVQRKGGGSGGKKGK